MRPSFAMGLPCAFFVVTSALACAPLFHEGGAATEGERAQPNDRKSNKNGEPIFATCQQTVPMNEGTNFNAMKVIVTGVPRGGTGGGAGLKVSTEAQGKFDIARVRIEGDYPTDKSRGVPLLGREVAVESIQDFMDPYLHPVAKTGKEPEKGTLLGRNVVEIRTEGRGLIRLVSENIAGQRPRQYAILSDMRPSLQMTGIGGQDLDRKKTNGCSFWHGIGPTFGTK